MLPESEAKSTLWSSHHELLQFAFSSNWTFFFYFLRVWNCSVQALSEVDKTFKFSFTFSLNRIDDVLQSLSLSLAMSVCLSVCFSGPLSRSLSLSLFCSIPFTISFISLSWFPFSLRNHGDWLIHPTRLFIFLLINHKKNSWEMRLSSIFFWNRKPAVTDMETSLIFLRALDHMKAVYLNWNQILQFIPKCNAKSTCQILVPCEVSSGSEALSLKP